MALGSHLITVRRLEKYINDVIGKKANLPDTSKTIIGNISQINSDLTNNTCTNLLNPNAQTQTKNGVTFTNNGDGTYTVNGTASAWTFVNINYVDSSTLSVPVGTYKLTGTPPNDGGARIQVMSTPGGQIGIDTGNGGIFTVPQGTTASHLRIEILSGTTCNNLLFKPMVTTDLNATYDDYVPYTGDSGRLNEDVAKINSDLTAYDNFNYNLISTADFAAGDANTFTIPNDTLLVRVRFWFAGTVDPQICYLNFDRRMPRLIQIADHYDATNGEARMTVEVNWRTMTTIIVASSLPNTNWHIGIQFYK